MEGSMWGWSWLRWELSGAAALVAVALGVAPADAQHRLFGRPRQEVCPPAQICPPLVTPAPAPVEPGKKPEPTKKEPTPAEAPPVVPPLAFEGGPAVRGSTFAYASPNLQGDQLGIPAIAFGPRGSTSYPPAPGQVPGAVVVPSVRSFKICDNDSPFPRDRVYVGFNYYSEVNKAVNQFYGSDLQNLRAYRSTVGVEKTCLDGNASVGLRLPWDTLNADSLVPGFGGESNAVGDLTIILKGVLLGDRDLGRVLTTGLAITTPTGPDRFAGYDNITANPHTTVLQPFIGGVWGMGDFFVQGYTALDVPTRSNDVTMWYTDIGVGYFLYRNNCCDSGITAIVPTLEVHVNSPLNHRGILHSTDPRGTPDVVALTTGVTFEVHRNITLALGCVTPVTGPRPFDWEMLAQVNVRFGGGSMRPSLLGY